MKQTKNVLCILISLALINPQYASGTTEPDVPPIPTDNSNVIFFTTAGLGIGSLSASALLRKRALARNPKLWSTKVFRSISRTGFIIGYLNLLAALIHGGATIVHGGVADIEDQQVSGYFHNIDRVWFAKGRLVYKGAEEREGQLKGKSPEEAYMYVSEVCNFNKSIPAKLNTPAASFNSRSQKNVHGVIYNYIEMGCPAPHVLVKSVYEVEYWQRYHMIFEEDAQRVKDKIESIGKDKVKEHGIFFPILSKEFRIENI